MKRPLIALTMGDPAGVGPEICLRALIEPEVLAACVPVVFGDSSILERVASTVGTPFTAKSFTEWRGLAASAQGGGLLSGVVDIRAISADHVTCGRIDARTGKASFDYIQAALDATLAGEVAAVCTAPINKEALHKAGIPFPGHTEMFAARTASDKWCMMQYSEEITCTFVTVHVGYAQVPALLSVGRILEVIELTAAGLMRIRGRKPKLVICGLNPHAGENGLFGDREEERFIIPAVTAARQRGIDIEGPVPPDTAFLPWKRKTTDAFVCLYHDQGHIPVKALAFDSAVNTTLGLPIIRTSVDHGTALDIAWQGKARPDSLFSAIRLAVKLAVNSC